MNIMNLRAAILQAASCVALFCFFGCSSAPKIIKTTRLDAVSEVDKKVTKQGVTVTVVPIINEGDAAQFPELATKISSMEKPLFADKAERVERPMPCILWMKGMGIAITVANNTGNSISLSGITVQMNVKGSDVQVVEYAPFLAELGTLAQTTAMQTLQNINYVGKSDKLKVLPGKKQTLYAAFNRKINEGDGTFTFQIYDLPVATDQAGNITKRENFDFNYNEITTSETK